MLTSDLVRVRRKGRELSVVPLVDKSRARALELAERFASLVLAHQGRRYGELREAFLAVEFGPREKKLAQGLIKLLEDRLELDAQAPVDPRALRRAVFTQAAALRRERPNDFDREAALRAAQSDLGLGDISLEALEEALHADLKSEKRVSGGSDLSPAALVEQYDTAQSQAVLLRATRVRARIRCRVASGYRRLFRALKFRRLLYTLQRQDEGYLLDIDGPFSLFESVTKYGLQLALLFPELLACDELSLDADVRWGKERTPLVFRFESKAPRAALDASELLPEVEELLGKLGPSCEGWRVEANERLLDLPGVGLIAPDLVFTRGATRVYFELLGYWSRDAVWKRVELVERGLGERIVFAVSSRLRVSEAVLDDEAAGALLVFKGTLSPKKVLERVHAVAAR